MEKFIDGLIRDFESGKLGRREFCQALGIATAIYAAGGAKANAAPDGRGFKALGINHVSYLCPDYRKARDFYSSMFGMQVLNDKGKGRANLAFGPEPGKGGNFLVVHNPGVNPPKASYRFQITLNARRHRRHYPITVRQGRIRFKPIWDRYQRP
jgi:Glyoxalase/Bleomycin resistance protein/Dioxygenase superfamily